MVMPSAALMTSSSLCVMKMIAMPRAAISFITLSSCAASLSVRTAGRFIKDQQLDALFVDLAGDFHKLHVADRQSATRVSSSIDMPTLSSAPRAS